MASTSQLVIRPATVADLPALVALEQASFQGDHLSARQYRKHMGSSSAAVLVATAADATLAGAAVLFFRRTSHVARLYSLAVDPAWRGHGVARQLLIACEVEARQRACTALRLEVRTDNQPAIALYRQAGYRDIGIRHAYYEDGTDALRMQLALAGNRDPGPATRDPKSTR